MGLFTLAHELHMTVSALMSTLPLNEYYGWCDWYEAQEKAIKKNAKSKSGGIDLLNLSEADLAKVKASGRF